MLKNIKVQLNISSGSRAGNQIWCPTTRKTTTAILLCTCLPESEIARCNINLPKTKKLTITTINHHILMWRISCKLLTGTWTILNIKHKQLRLHA